MSEDGRDKLGHLLCLAALCAAPPFLDTRSGPQLVPFLTLRTPETLLGGLLPTHPSSSLSGSPEQQKALWLEQLLQFVQKKNSLVAEEAELMIT